MKIIRHVVVLFLAILSLLPLLVVCALIGLWRRLGLSSIRNVTFGGCGIINIHGWSRALNAMNIRSETVVWSTPAIYQDNTFNRDLKARYGVFAGILAPWEFLRSVAKSRIIVCGFDGFLLGITPLRRLEMRLLHIAGCKVVASPYGGDAYVYAWVCNESLRHALQISYPRASREQTKIANRVRRVIRYADFVMPGMMGFDGLGRWDVLAPSHLVIDIEDWQPTEHAEPSHTLRVTHTPNHRGFKGTEFLIEAVENLKTEGFSVELTLLEGVSNSDVKRVLTEQTDVLVEQLIHVGYAMSALEGMATGNIVISNLADSRIVDPMRRWTFLRHCPIVSATPETIEEVLKGLIRLKNDEAQFQQLKNSTRAYVARWHSYKTFGEFFGEVTKVLFHERDSMLTYFSGQD